MKNAILIIASVLTSFALTHLNKPEIINMENNSENAKPFVDYSAFGKLVQEVEQHRVERLITFDEFLQKSEEANTIILDTRSKAMYDLKHIKGAIHLNFSDFTQFSLDEILVEYAGKNSQILIYCNNNFTDIGNTIKINELSIRDMDQAFVSKVVIPAESVPQLKLPKKIGSSLLQSAPPTNNELTLALNIPTYINLFGYGYKNVFELNELVDVKDSRIEFEGSFDDL